MLVKRGPCQQDGAGVGWGMSKSYFAKRFALQLAAVFLGMLAAFAAIIIGSTIHHWYGLPGMVAVLTVAYVLWLVTVRLIQQPQRETPHYGSGGSTLPVVRRSSDIARHGS